MDINNNHIKCKKATGSIVARCAEKQEKPIDEEVELPEAKNLPSHWLFSNNVIESTETSYEEGSHIGLLTTVSTMEGSAIIENNRFILPFCYIDNIVASNYTTSPNDTYIIRNNLFRITRFRTAFWAKWYDNWFIQESDSNLSGDDILSIVGMSSKGGVRTREITTSIDTRKVTKSSRPIYLEFYKNRPVSGYIKVEIIDKNNEKKQGHITFETKRKTEGGELFLYVYDVTNGQPVYPDSDDDQELNPEKQEGKNFCSGIFRAILYPPSTNGLSRIQSYAEQVLQKIEFSITETLEG